MSHLVKGNSAGGEPPAESNDDERNSPHKGECSEQAHASSTPDGQPPEPAQDEELRQRTVAFLKRFRPDGPWIVSAIHPERAGVETATFSAGQEANLRDWIEERNGTKNLYFQVNESARSLTKKATKEDIVAACWLHVDVDPREDHEVPAEQARILEALQQPPEGIPKPTLIIFSGGGYQAFWQLKNRYLLDGKNERAADFERFNRALERAFGGDHCHNVDRIMRLPYTLNLPNERKRKKGRMTTLACVVEFDPARVYPLGDFEPAPNEIAPPDQTVDWQPASATIDDLRSYDLPARLLRLLEEGTLEREEGPKKRDTSRSAWRADFVVGCVRAQVPDALIYGVLTNPAYKLAAIVLEKGSNADRTARRVIEWAHKAVVSGPVLLPADDHLAAARSFLLRHYSPNAELTLRCFNGDFLEYDGAAYREVEDRSIDSDLWRFLGDALIYSTEPPHKPYRPNNNKVANVRSAVAALTHLDRTRFAPPQWLCEAPKGFAAKELLACRNGLFHVPSGALLPSSSEFFTRSSVAFDFDSNAPAPSEWFAFLSSIWPQHPDQIRHLQEVMGYLLTDDTSLQKAFLLAGPPRSGKGTIARLITALVGDANVCSLPLNSFGDQFGLQPLIGRKVAFVSDMRMDRKTPKAAVTENLLRVTGEDWVTVPRKWKDSWEGVLSARFVIMTNVAELPNDESGALANRMVISTMTESFLGKEDPALTTKLLAELPGIMNWAIEGLRRLRQRGHFLEPATSRDVRFGLNEVSQPISTFVEECCELDREASCAKSDLYEAYQRWCHAAGMRPKGRALLFRDLYAGFRGQVRELPRESVSGKRVPRIAGMRLRPSLGGPPPF